MSRQRTIFRWMVASAGLWVLSAGVELYGQWLLLKPPPTSFFGDPFLSMMLAAYALVGAAWSALFVRYTSRNRVRWFLFLLPPVFLSLAGLVLSRSGVLSGRGVAVLLCSIAAGSIFARILGSRRPRLRLSILLLLIPVPVLIGVPGDSDGPGATRREARTGRNLILVTIDTLRPDHLGLAGYRRNTSPGLDSLSAHGVLFRQAYATAPATAPSIASLLTGRYPIDHGVLRNGWPFPGDVVTLASFLRDRGYATGAAVSVAHLASGYGWRNGFQWYNNQGRLDHLFPYSRLFLPRLLTRFVPLRFTRLGAHTIQRAVEWLDSAETPFFLWLHLWDPHAPYTPPDDLNLWPDEPTVPAHATGFTSERLFAWIDGYDGEIRYTDRCLSALWSRLRRNGMADSTVIAVVSDHGESIGERSFQGHSIFLYDEQTRVLFAVISPFQSERAGSVVERPVSLIDLAPTVLSLLNLDDGSWEGEGVALLETPEDSQPLRPLFGETEMWGFSGRSVRFEQWKLIEREASNPSHPGFAPVPDDAAYRTGHELYDMQSDPDEAINRIDELPGVAAMLESLLTDYTHREDRGVSTSPVFDPALKRQLQELGYLD